ncbi:MAG: hypothetical protein CL947_03760 [Epsilonproteobacteria bacterium]|nr:hypothetical protein [Campylobacterota bacterium]|tara:strand:- start:762 stop:2333 length:1572 start_codon:yes stop_codon:yes gene_type:complete
MNIREMIFPLMLAMTASFTVQYFMGPENQQKNLQNASGKSFVAPEVQKAQKPLNRDVVFDKEKNIEINKHIVTTDLGIYTFSSKGAILESLEIFWQNKTKNVQLLADDSNCFLLALSDKTPQNYNFVREYKLNDLQATAVEYTSKFYAGVITKTFVVYNDTYKIDVKVNIDYHQKEAKNAEVVRLLFPMTVGLDTGGSPYGDYELCGITNKAATSNDLTLRNINLSKQLQEFVFEPKVFGFADKFLIQSLVQTGEQKPMRGYFNKVDSQQYQAILESAELEKDTTFTWSFYFGPKVKDALEKVSPVLLQTIDYGWFSFVAKPMLLMLNILKDYVGSYGIAIILLTILLNMLLLPFRLKGEKSMRQQADFQKKLAYIRQKYKHDKAAMDAASAELMQKHGFGGVAGCLPMLMNIPFFIALSRVLSGSFALYGAKFLWLADLSAKDPYYILGILTGICMLMTPMNGSTQQQSAMRYGSALIFGTITTYLSSGLALFIFINTLFSLLQGFVMRAFTGRGSSFVSMK